MRYTACDLCCTAAMLAFLSRLTSANDQKSSSGADLVALHAPLTELGYAFAKQKPKRAKWSGLAWSGGCGRSTGKCAADTKEAVSWTLDKAGKVVTIRDALSMASLKEKGFTVTAWVRMKQSPEFLESAVYEHGFRVVDIDCGEGPLFLHMAVRPNPPPFKYTHVCEVLDADKGRQPDSAEGYNDMAEKQWWHISCTVDGTSSDSDWHLNRRAFFGNHDDLRPGFNDVSWAKVSDDVLEDVHIPPGTTTLIRMMKDHQKCDVMIGARNSGIAVHHVRITHGALERSAVYKIAAATPFSD